MRITLENAPNNMVEGHFRTQGDAAQTRFIFFYLKTYFQPI